MNVRSINQRLSGFWSRLATAANLVCQDGQLGQVGNLVKWNVGVDGSTIGYSVGELALVGGLDPLWYLLGNTQTMGARLGVSAEEIWSRRRDMAFVQRCLDQLEARCDLGRQDGTPLLYVSRSDGNAEGVDLHRDWVDCIFSQDWIDQLAERSLASSTWSSDPRLDSMASYVQDRILDHELQQHRSLESFDPDLYLDRPDSEFLDVLQRLNSFGQLNYCVYEMYKPIGKVAGRHVKAKLFANGRLEVSGVLGLQNCVHVPWEHGSMDYLRSLNTGNQRYEFKLTRPWNDENSFLYWKPDEPILEEDEEEEDGEGSDSPSTRDSDGGTGDGQVEVDVDEGQWIVEAHDDEEDPEVAAQLQQVEKIISSANPESTDPIYANFKEYEDERYLRWFGTTYIPLLDSSTLFRKTICCSPQIEDSGELDATDATQLLADPSTIRPATYSGLEADLLTLQQKATVDLVEREDGQWLQFVVDGSQETTNLSFCIVGQELGAVEDLNHYVRTLGRMNSLYVNLTRAILFLDMVGDGIGGNDAWLEFAAREFPSDHDDFVPTWWTQVHGQLGPLVWHPSATDLIRARQLDLDELSAAFDGSRTDRMDAGLGFPDWPGEGNPDLSGWKSTQLGRRLAFVVSEWRGRSGTSMDTSLWNYMRNYDAPQAQWTGQKVGETDKTMFMELSLDNSRLGSESRTQVQTTMETVLTDKWEIGYETTVDDLRDRMQTYNTLVVRLPVGTRLQQTNSMHIFLDWQNYVNGSLEWLEGKGLLWRGEPVTETGTDGLPHSFVEWYTDEARTTPLVDYSYIYDPETKKPVKDRWDWWTPGDFRGDFR